MKGIDLAFFVSIVINMIRRFLHSLFSFITQKMTKVTMNPNGVKVIGTISFLFKMAMDDEVS